MRTPSIPPPRSLASLFRFVAWFLVPLCLGDPSGGAILEPLRARDRSAVSYSSGSYRAREEPPVCRRSLLCSGSDTMGSKLATRPIPRTCITSCVRVRLVSPKSGISVSSASSAISSLAIRLRANLSHKVSFSGGFLLVPAASFFLINHSSKPREASR